VVHVHPQHLVALTQIAEYAAPETLNHLLWSMHPEMKILVRTGIGFVPYACPGTKALADASVKAFTDQSLLVWEKHGCVAMGSDVHEAFDIIACADKAAEIYFICRSAGYEPEGLTPEQLRELDTMYTKGIETDTD
jgi:rhamnulose-1-phosphate aldolase